jgi:ribulose-phosphate 3-epimerase
MRRRRETAALPVTDLEACVPVKIAPSILTADFGRIAEQVQEAVEGGADYIHLDVMDGHFVPVITFGPSLVGAIRKTVDVPLDIHLMIENPETQIEAFRDAGGDILNVHVEATAHLHRVLQEIKRIGAKAGVCLNPATALEALDEVLPDVDQVMVMAVNPGWGGQSFIEASLAKVTRLRAEIDRRQLHAEIEVDGGVNLTTGPRCAAAGADVLVAGSFVYNDRASVGENIAALRKALG